ncbi:efflux RND transporter periplasmic adaptor subunit [Sphingomicrobium sp. B8]|uniref:Efflux RND transporter periplasmic adaptor subunit n=2 Tax=Sphingomicrobium clamense TaxID=2851013 RepID=A0ABS6V817_9SPHN|nr:efflux RND transporter periplasmic adaptor subunit [Sphingomicrobium sp. B8]MBW0145740.1 efflux RND transporter periplasmic adaptor subunit [Sphingomicrobium sp. B8]
MNEQSATLAIAADEELEARRKKRRILMIVGAVLVLALVVFGLSRIGGNASDSPAAAGAQRAGQAARVTVIVPGASDVARTITASGSLEARRDQPVGVSGQGGRVVSVLAEPGDWVRQGQLLAQIERSVQSQEAAQIRANVAAAQADAALAKNELDRAKALEERGFVSKADIDRKQAAYDAANARVRVNQAQLGATNARIAQLDVRAPTSGLILDRNVEVGQVVSAGTPMLFRMARGGEMEMRAKLSQQDLNRVSVGMPVEVTPVGSDKVFTGTIWQVSPVIDPQNRQGEVRIAIPYDEAIRPGGFAEARISGGVTSAPLLPQSAVLADAAGNYVYIVNDNDEVERRNVTVGRVDDEGVTIAAGIDGTERVVSRAGSFLAEGRKVDPVREAAAQE